MKEHLNIQNKCYKIYQFLLKEKYHIEIEKVQDQVLNKNYVKVEKKKKDIKVNQIVKMLEVLIILKKEQHKHLK